MIFNNQRIAYGNTLVEVGRENEKVVALEADLGKSTMSCLFQEAFPERYFEMGIAEANMASVAAGLAQTGRIPFIHSFAVFSLGRAYDQIRQTIAIGKLNVKICGSSSGMSDFGDGATHQAIEDMALARAIPNMTVLCPADAIETVKMVRAMPQIEGPCYIRLNRNNCNNIISEDEEFELGVPRVLKQGSDIVVFACGVMVEKALEAAKMVEDKIAVKVVNVSTIKPLKQEYIIELVQGCKGIVTAEEHSIIGGLGSAIAQAVCKECKPIEFIGINDTFGCSGHSYKELLEYYNLTVERIVEGIKMIYEIN